MRYKFVFVVGVMNMNRYLLLTLLFFSEATFSKSVAFVGDLYGKKDVLLIGGVDFTVPECRKLLIKDSFKFTGNTWLSIDGGMEIYSAERSRQSGKHIIEGNFEYRTERNSTDDYVVVLPSSKVTLFSKESVDKAEASLFKWVQPERVPCEH